MYIIQPVCVLSIMCKLEKIQNKFYSRFSQSLKKSMTIISVVFWEFDADSCVTAGVEGLAS